MKRLTTFLALSFIIASVSIAQDLDIFWNMQRQAPEFRQGFHILITGNNNGMLGLYAIYNPAYPQYDRGPDEV